MDFIIILNPYQFRFPGKCRQRQLLLRIPYFPTTMIYSSQSLMDAARLHHYNAAETARLLLQAAAIQPVP